MAEMDVIYVVISLAATIVGALGAVRYYKQRFFQLVDLAVAIRNAWEDDNFTDSEIKDIVDRAVEFGRGVSPKVKVGT